MDTIHEPRYILQEEFMWMCRYTCTYVYAIKYPYQGKNDRETTTYGRFLNARLFVEAFYTLFHCCFQRTGYTCMHCSASYFSYLLSIKLQNIDNLTMSSVGKFLLVWKLMILFGQSLHRKGNVRYLLYLTKTFEVVS